MNTSSIITNSPARGFSTEEAAEAVRAKPQTLRAGYCKNGHWCNVVPVKLPNGRLIWPSDQIQRLTTGTATTKTGGDSCAS